MKDILQQTDPKTTLRNESVTRRDSIPVPVRKIKDSAVSERLFTLDKFIAARTILLYASFRSEVATGGVIEKAFQLGKRVIMPRANSEELRLDLYEVKSSADLKPGYMGIPEPDAISDNSAEVENVDLVVIPGAAFDSRGNRLGYGKGYYDKLLSDESARPSLVALAYEEQMVEDVPAEPHDVRVDIVITDRQTVYCKGSGNEQEEN